MIIVAGHLRVDPADRASYLDTCQEVVTLARGTKGCLDFALSADIVDADRINILERWETLEDVQAFRGEGTGDDLGARILGADVREFEASSETKL
ncbi:putative quinol monooxygenase [Antrihabitans stalactiti]|uniref:Antibiotic biosynthesis monooxygenase n=1 Tax=Antrihabitans stalactiti TaxID=2584121 RepID=A0A848KLI5_9NOCA|nr:antibiotic biosynthesis monooxygenase family protein [Antrihabitans stalactiti]NMN97854.1 antibiotic biosynthesis monooxygenase [Antrihabitans stalactiti]